MLFGGDGLMRRQLIIGMIIIILLLVSSGCMNKDLSAFSEEKENLTNELLELKNLLSEKNEKINRLEQINSNKTIELEELKESLEIVRFSSYARLSDYNDTFDNLENVYGINSNYIIKDDWYVISDDYFQIELFGYENAKRVDFYLLRMESGEGTLLIFSDIDFSDGWIYTNDNIAEIIEKHKSFKRGRFSYEPYFVIYAEVTLEDGTIIRTPKLPIYNQLDLN